MENDIISETTSAVHDGIVTLSRAFGLLTAARIRLSLTTEPRSALRYDANARFVESEGLSVTGLCLR